VPEEWQHPTANPTDPPAADVVSNLGGIEQAQKFRFDFHGHPSICSPERSGTTPGGASALLGAPHEFGSQLMASDPQRTS
jgi:hypothetical protein